MTKSEEERHAHVGPVRPAASDDHDVGGGVVDVIGDEILRVRHAKVPTARKDVDESVVKENIGIELEGCSRHVEGSVEREPETLLPLETCPHVTVI